MSTSCRKIPLIGVPKCQVWAVCITSGISGISSCVHKGVSASLMPAVTNECSCRSFSEACKLAAIARSNSGSVLRMAVPASGNDEISRPCFFINTSGLGPIKNPPSASSTRYPKPVPALAM